MAACASPSSFKGPGGAFAPSGVPSLYMLACRRPSWRLTKALTACPLSLKREMSLSRKRAPPCCASRGFASHMRRRRGRCPCSAASILRLQPDETLALMGESGSGKSTLLHLIGALDHADGGEILHRRCRDRAPLRKRSGVAAAREDRRRLPAVQSHREPHGRRESRLSGEARRPLRSHMAGAAH